MVKRKSRDQISSEISAKVLFISDRTCCVCRIPTKLVQIHHLDGNNRNNSIDNLAVLCFDCHRETQIQGGFDRKLNVEQIVLYRENWHSLVNMQRSYTVKLHTKAKLKDGINIQIATSLAEIYRENKQYESLAMHYDNIGNKELRDKYIELAIQNNPSDQSICFLRGLQGKEKIIPKKIISRELKRYSTSKNWSQRARFYNSLGKSLKAAQDYIEEIRESLKNKNLFSAAFYLKEMVKAGIVEALFLEAFKVAHKKKDLWWQVRVFEELRWEKELKKLLESNAKKIEKSGDTMLLLLLAKARGQKDKAIKLMKDIANNSRFVTHKNNKTAKGRDKR
ncbi:MAG: HNH endonuclease [Dehalococcoidia bacterium]|nr:MAG: HNH endonuclease [Dehalococcoidia bacterium]